MPSNTAPANATLGPGLLAHHCAAAVGLAVDPLSLIEHQSKLPLDLSGQYHRLADISEGITYCSVQKPQHKVVAVNLRLGNDGIAVLLAANDTVPQATVDHCLEDLGVFCP